MSLRHMEDRADTPPSGGHSHSHAHHHGVAQPLGAQFEDIDQQNESYIVGMWTFLVTEIMFFGALFLAYSVYRTLYFDTYMDAHRFLDVTWGTINTFVLLTSSFTMVVGVWAAQQGKKWLMISMLAATIACSFIFLGIKYIEYSTKINEGLLPGRTFDYRKANRIYAEHHGGEHGGHGGGHAAPGAIDTHGQEDSLTRPLDNPENATPHIVDTGHGDPGTAGKDAAVVFDYTPKEGWNTMAADPDLRQPSPQVMGLPVIDVEARKEEVRGRRAQLFFSIYFTMTGLHGIHVLVGILMMSVLMWMRAVDHIAVRDYMPTEMVGLYWHFVDIVWIFLFPLMYLIS